jgi:ApeA N-terminal domain 1
MQVCAYLEIADRNEVKSSMTDAQQSKSMPSFGEFRVGESSIFGELKIDGEQTNLRLHSHSYIQLHEINGGQIFGELSDRSKVSLIDCNERGSGRRTAENKTSYFADVFPHYVLVGNSYFSSDSPTTISVHWQLPDLDKVFYDFDAFGSSIEPEKFISEIVSEIERHTGRTIVIGDRPVVQYFTGKHTVFSCAVGQLIFEINHGFQQNFGGPQGVWLKNKMRASLRFTDPVMFKDAIHQAYSISRFLSLVVGRPQDINELYIEMGQVQGTETWTVVPSFPERHQLEACEISPGPRDTLLDGVRRQDELTSVLKHWLNTDSKMAMPRGRLWDSFKKQNYFDADRMIAAANLFDTISNDHSPGSPELDANLIGAIAEAYKLFRPLPNSPERESILRELSRIQRHTLRTKVKHWASEISNQQDITSEDLSYVIDRAVKCRNFLVHGGEREFDYDKELDLFAFLVRTFEFCYVIPEFIKAGWAGALHGQMHPFGAYRDSFSESLKNLRLVVSCET